VRTGGVGGTRRQSALERSARLAHRLLTETAGQDLIEYALLTGIIAVAAAAVFPGIRTRMAAAYQAWLTGAQNLSEPAPPA
jgi:Flp pilus assembly pilin Flp